jgi:hypothetical protein
VQKSPPTNFQNDSMVRSRVEEACAQLLTDLAKRWQANKM